MQKNPFDYVDRIMCVLKVVGIDRLLYGSNYYLACFRSLPNQINVLRL